MRVRPLGQARGPRDDHFPDRAISNAIPGYSRTALCSNNCRRKLLSAGGHEAAIGTDRKARKRPCHPQGHQITRGLQRPTVALRGEAEGMSCPSINHLSPQTLASKLQRGSSLSDFERKSIGSTLGSYGIRPYARILVRFEHAPPHLFIGDSLPARRSFSEGWP